MVHKIKLDPYRQILKYMCTYRYLVGTVHLLSNVHVHVSEQCLGVEGKHHYLILGFLRPFLTGCLRRKTSSGGPRGGGEGERGLDGEDTEWREDTAKYIKQ